ncbi:hypothetical protein [Pseudoduganella chitinolytica]|uniref:Uncharacterized protein n=1 Tax=Pseudoduganella chitinolytica TaxID=34070 RepID=A0ABY8B7P0_9BURK|nr:hypothetical protein [Pseudoduganella chitinolytica]WEF31949.1 hypothetical protein PX653_21335 [Pseudoduganella chitinolytica]
MRTLRFLLIALFFLLGSTAALAASYDTCCPQDECTAERCAAMGCLSAAPALAVDTSHAVAVAPATAAASAPLPCAGPLVVRDVWTPPD